MALQKKKIGDGFLADNSPVDFSISTIGGNSSIHNSHFENINTVVNVNIHQYINNFNVGDKPEPEIELENEQDKIESTSDLLKTLHLKERAISDTSKKLEIFNLIDSIIESQFKYISDEILLTLYNTRANYYRNFKNKIFFKNALKYYHLCEKIFEKNPNKYQIQQIYFYSNLGSFYYDLLDTKKALFYQNKAITIEHLIC